MADQSDLVLAGVAHEDRDLHPVADLEPAEQARRLRLDESRSVLAGVLLLTGDFGPSRRMAQELFEGTDARADSQCDWLLEPAGVSRADF